MSSYTDLDAERRNLDNILRHPNIDDHIFITLIVASFVGELVMRVSLLFGLIYWLAITPFFFIASIVSEKAKTIQTGRETAHLIKYELFYWGSAFIAVILVFLLWDTERIGPLEASIIVHIILAHTMFLSGIVLGLRFYLVGILLFATATLSITTQLTLNFSLDLVVIALITWLGLKVKNQFILPIFKRESDFTKSKDGYPGKERRTS
ncbi:MAG: hypothetical protein KAT04_15480 [Methylococcales bacterium]|nr:hypothetical protein [Methylococcales bacterium]